jgi:hypothetical protein
MGAEATQEHQVDDAQVAVSKKAAHQVAHLKDREGLDNSPGLLDAELPASSGRQLV